MPSIVVEIAEPGLTPEVLLIARRRTGMDRAAAGKLLGYTARAIKAWERRERHIPADDAPRMAALLRKACEQRARELAGEDADSLAILQGGRALY
jgi:hypothetical protein